MSSSKRDSRRGSERSGRRRGRQERCPTPAQGSESLPVSEAQLSAETESRLTLRDPGPSAPCRPFKSLPRPGFGASGVKCLVRANHFSVHLADVDVHHYDVAITPEVISKKVNRDIISKLQLSYSSSQLGGWLLAYDGMKSVYTAGPLPFEYKEFFIYLDNKGSSSSNKGQRFKVTIQFASKPDIYHLKQFLCGKQTDAPYHTIQALDVVLRATQFFKGGVVAIGRSFFSSDVGQKGELGDGVEFWRGYYQSLRSTQSGMTLNIDVSAMGFYEPISVIHFVEKNMKPRDMYRPLSDQDRVKLRKSLRGIKVRTTHRMNNRDYKITGVTSLPANQTMFCRDTTGEQESVIQYFQDRYSIVFKYPFMPALQAGSDAKPIFLPMEVCKIVEGQRYPKKYNERQVTNLLRATCQRPMERAKSIEKVKHDYYTPYKKVYTEFGIDIKDGLALVEARVLNPPTLIYHQTGEEKTVVPSIGQWNMIKKKMVNGGRVDCWTCINFSSKVNEMQYSFCKQLIDMCASKGMVFNPNPVIRIGSADPSKISTALLNIFNMVQRLPNPKLQLLIIILPDYGGSYGKIKTICETELGIVSQCCQPSKVLRVSKQYLENIALKINVKVGGRNTVLNDAVSRLIPLVSQHPTIILGADVSHPPPGEAYSPSIAAVVGSMDWPEITKYRALVAAQGHREEIIKDLYKLQHDPVKGVVHKGMIRELFIAFRRATGQKPRRIVFYRDGVSEGQFSHVLFNEVDGIRKACASLEDGYLPPITFIVVQKRHHTRLFPEMGKTDKSGNVLPGTVVDNKICHPFEFDFYLNSHAGIQGTSRPAHYHVLLDENEFTADLLQGFTNNLCYTYARCTRSVSIVPPAYYAHLTAFRARYYMEETCGSESTGEVCVGGSALFHPLPEIKDNVKEVMFYC